MSGFIGSGKPSNLVTTLSNHTSLLRGGLLEGEWGSLDDGRAGWLLGVKASSREQGPDFDLLGTLWTVCRTRDSWGHAYDVSIRFLPCRVYIDLNHYDTLGYEWSLARCCHLVVYLGVMLMVRGWLWLWLLWWLLYYFNNNVNYLVDAYFLFVIIYRCKHNTWLN
jgi:hypothetical protein